MKVNMKGLINQLDDLRERLNELFDKLEELEDLDYDIAVEDFQRYFLAGDTFNLSIAISVLEQVDKLDKALEIIKKKKVNVGMFINCCMNVDYQFYLDHHKVIMNGMSSEEFTEEEFNSLKEELL